MTRLHKISLLLLFLCFILTCAAFAAPPGISPEDAKQIMPVSQLKRGMRGYGLTVFHGTKIEKFDVEILGVLKQANMGKDLILVRIGGGPITSRQTSIMEGMSGSPCYINGKLVGAVAYGLPFAKEPVGMLTPIADMLEAWDQNLPKQASGYSSPQTLEQPVNISGATVKKIGIDPTGAKSGVHDGTLYMQPLMTPMMVSGLSPRGIERLADILRPFHIQPMAGPGGGKKTGVKAELVPGAAVGMSLASGDVDLTGIGTVTYRRGNKVLAFGHPVLGIGAIDAPMTTAWVDDVLSCYESSMKMASPIETVGRIFQDRSFSTAGQVGSMPRTIPVTITVDDRSFKRTKTYKVNIIDHPLLASRLATLVTGEAIYESHPTPGDATAEVTYNVVADRIGKITRSNVFFDPVSVDTATISDVGTLLNLLSSNQFHPLDIKSLDVKVRILDKRNTATIDRIFVKKTEYQPGETVDVGVVLRPYKAERITKTYKIKIPATAADGKVTLLVRGGGASASPMGAMMAAVAGGDDDGSSMMGLPGASDMANADNVKQLVDKYLEREKNNEVVLQLQLRSTALNVAGEKLTGLPSSIASVMKSSRNSGVRVQRDEVKAVFDEDMIVGGLAKLSITVKREDLKESKTPARPSSASSDEEITSPDASISSPPADLDEMIDYSTDARLRLQADEPDISDSGDDEPSDDSVVVAEPDQSEDVVDDTAPDVEVTAGKPNASEKPKTESNKTDANVKTVVRQPKTWTLKTQAEYAKGTFSGVSASSLNKLELAPTLQKVAETTEQFVWSTAPAKDGVYAGTGNAGKIYHVTDGGKVELYYETGELEVHALVRDSKGNLYAGTSPNGKIFKIAPDGKGEMLYKVAEKYVMALAVDGEGNLYAGAGDAGKVYRIAPNGDGAVFSDINEQQILSLHWDARGSLLVGTGINGNVYRVHKSGKAVPIFDATEDAVTSVTCDGDGNVYAGTSPKGVVYKIDKQGRAESVYTKGAQILSMAGDSHNNVYAVSDGSLVRIAPDKTVTVLDSGRDKVQFLALTYNDFTGALYASTGNIGTVYSSRCCDVIGTYQSPVHDAKMISRWGRIKWTAQTPDGTNVEVQTRIGNVDTPDSTWSDWSQPCTKSAGEQIVGQDARYIQYRVTLKTDKAEVSPRVSTVTVSYLTPNQPPKVTLTAPTAGEVWSGAKTVKWTAADPDKDTLTYDVFYSKDGGKEWKTLAGGVSGTKAADGKSDKEITDKIKSELDKSPDVPEDMKKAVLKAESGDKPNNTPDMKKDGGKTFTNTSYSWDTKKMEDGEYVVKVVATDKSSNPTGALTEEAISDPFTICNSAPAVTVYEKGVELKAAGPAKLNGSASSKLVEIVGVQFRVDGGQWTAAAPGDGMFDSPYEVFGATTGDLASGTHKVDIEAVDAAGNASTKTVEVKVS